MEQYRYFPNRYIAKYRVQSNLTVEIHGYFHLCLFAHCNYAKVLGVGFSGPNGEIGHEKNRSALLLGIFPRLVVPRHVQMG